jgi:hypothetical protein
VNGVYAVFVLVAKRFDMKGLCLVFMPVLMIENATSFDSNLPPLFLIL